MVINKLQSDDFYWNNNPRDVSAFTEFLDEDTEQNFNWQVVPLASPVTAWLDAPVLYCASADRLPWPADSVQAEKLKNYAQRGGLLLFPAERDSRSFRASVTELMRDSFPGYSWRKLPPDHAVYHLVFDLKRKPTEVWGLTNGVRELALLLPRGDIPGVLQTLKTGETLNSRQAAALDLLSNIIHYASGMEPLPPRLASYHINESQNTPGKPSVTYNILRGVYGDLPDPEPLSLQMFSVWLRSSGGELNYSTVPVSKITADDNHHFVIISGIDSYEFTPEEMASINNFITEGGTVLFETIGGRGDFARAAQRQFSSLLGVRAVPLRSHPLITGRNLPNGKDCRQVGYTAFALSRFGVLETRPRLRGMEVKGRVGLIFSNDDISHALLNRPVWGVSGYDTTSARRLLFNMLAYSR